MVIGGYGEMTLTNTTLKRDPSATNPAMRSSRGRKQLTLVDNETMLVLVQALQSANPGGTRKKEATGKVLM